jgi:hypothetical protein
MLRWTRIAACAGAVLALVVLTSGASFAANGSGAAHGQRASSVAVGVSKAAAARRLSLLRNSDFSTRAGAWKYLRAIGLDPRSVVIQRGARNYAGPKCPGAGWTCSASRHVLQIGAVNAFTCTPSSPNDCNITQVGGGNVSCTQTNAGPTQKCTISQTNDTNKTSNNATVIQILTQSGSSSGTQTATQTTSIVQSATKGASNNAGVTQNVIQLLGRGAAALNDDNNNADDFTAPTASPIMQKQDAYQRLSVVQSTSNTSGAAGNNTSGILQTLLQRARADHTPSITQLQNTVAQDESPQCPLLSGSDDAGANPNQCNAVQQTSSNGKNTSLVKQDYRQFEAASNSPAGLQQQGPDPIQGGLEHRFAQSSVGISSQTSDQLERQVMRRAPGAVTLTANQFGPVRKGTGTQTGNAGDTAKQTQQSTQISTPAGPTATQTNLVGDQCASQGNCSVNQTVTQNGNTTTNSDSGSTVNETVVCPAGETCTSNPAPEGSIVVPAGGSNSVNRSFNVPATPPTADIEIAIDTTGSMAPSIAQAQTDANNIVSGVQAQIPGAQFAVVDFKDDVDGAAEYVVRQAMTSTASNITAAINAMTATGGGDNPEAYNLVFQNSYTPATGGDIGWRTGSRKFVIVIGDAEPHGAGTEGMDLSGCTDTSADPHGLNTATELANMNLNQRTLFMIHASSGSASLECYQSIPAEAFLGGQGVEAGTNLATQIVALINSATSTVGNVHLEVNSTPAGASASWLSFSPTSYTNVNPLPANKSFDINISVPAGTPTGLYTFDVKALADGADIGHTSIPVFVP